MQVDPSSIAITSGAARIACLRLSPNGLLRWYAACCDTPLANTVGTPNVPLAGMWRPNFETVAPFGPVTTLGFTKMSLPGGPRRDKGLYRMLGGLLKRMIAGALSGRLSRSPFFDEKRAPVAAPTVLDPAERAALDKEKRRV